MQDYLFCMYNYMHSVSATKIRQPRSAKRPKIPPSGGRGENKKKFLGGCSEVLLGRSAAFPGIDFGCPGQFQMSLLDFFGKGI